MRIDQTAHKMYMQCPRKYEIRYVKGLILPPPAALFLGSTVHHSLAHLGRNKIENNTLISLGDFLDHFATTFDTKDVYVDEEGSNLKNLPDIDWEGERPGEVKDLGIGMLKVYHQKRAPQIQPVQIEVTFEKTFNQEGDILYGRIDRTDLNGQLIDYKTAKKKSMNLSHSQNNIDQDIQPTAYGFGVGGPVFFGFEFLLKSDPPELAWRETARTQRDINWYLKMLDTDIKGIKAGFFPCRPNWSCMEWCGYRSICGYRL